MTPLGPPPIVFRDTRWSPAELAGLAQSWRASLEPRLGGGDGPVALVMPNHPRAVALLFALSCFPAPVVVLPPDARPWRSDPPLPPGTRVVLLPEQGALADDARALGAAVAVLPEAAERAPAAAAPFMRTAGVVLFTSGSTGAPRPVYRETTRLLAVGRALVSALGLAPGDGVLGALPLSRAFGLNHALIAAALLGSELALLERFEYHALLGLFARGGARYWAGTPVMADALARSRGAATHPAPAVCAVGGRVSADLAARFRARFGVPLRQAYGTTETGTLTVDGGPPDRVRPERAGRPVPGVELRIGDDPRAPEPPGVPGRIWVRAPEHLMSGHGFPPDVTPVETDGGWWGSPDVGALDADGCLALAGRVDDCFRTGAGFLVSPATVALALDGYPGVVEAAVVPLPARTGPVLGVLVESDGAVAPSGVRAHLARALPPWSQPSVVETTRALPRLPSGRADRRACIAVLASAAGGR